MTFYRTLFNDCLIIYHDFLQLMIDLLSRKEIKKNIEPGNEKRKENDQQQITTHCEGHCMCDQLETSLYLFSSLLLCALFALVKKFKFCIK